MLKKIEQGMQLGIEKRIQKEQKIYGYMRVSTREQNEERQRIALLEMGVPEKQIYMDKVRDVIEKNRRTAETA